MTTTDGISLRHFAAPNPNCTALTYNQKVSLIIHNQTSLCHYGHCQCNFHCHRNLYSHSRHHHRHFVLIIVLAIKPLTPLPAVSARNSAQRDLIWQLRDELSHASDLFRKLGKKNSHRTDEFGGSPRRIQTPNREFQPFQKHEIHSRESIHSERYSGGFLQKTYSKFES